MSLVTVIFRLICPDRPGLVSELSGWVVINGGNIHHSFLPTFKGAQPYQRGWECGVKLIGATAHYATEDLDQGPIIEQDVIRLTHREGRKKIIELGKEVERSVLARSVKWHLEDRIFIVGNKTIVFN